MSSVSHILKCVDLPPGGFGGERRGGYGGGEGGFGGGRG